MRTLVLYYSFTGNTRQVATLLADILGADIAEITCKTYTYGFLGGLRQAWDTLTGGTPTVELPKQISDNYDLVIGAGPVWGARPAPPLRSFVKGFQPKTRQLALVLTCDGTSPKFPGEKALDEIITAAPVAPIATHLFKRADIEADDLRAKIQSFADELTKANA